MVKKILIGAAVVVVLFLVFVAMQPADFTITRSAIINAPQASIFAKVNDLHQFNAWSPFHPADAHPQESYDGPASGVGAAYHWDGGSQMGAGTMTITDSHASDLVKMRLDFLKPMHDTNTAQFTFQPQGSQTLVTWSMSGKKNFLAKGITLFMNMDKMVGGEFERGLANLKAASEKPVH